MDQQTIEYLIDKDDFEQDLKGKDGLQRIHEDLLRQKKDLRSNVSNFSHQCQIYHEAITEIELEQIRVQQYIVSKQIDRLNDDIESCLLGSIRRNK